MISAVHWHESAMGVHVPPALNHPPTTLPMPSSRLSQCTGFECPISCIELGPVLHFTYGSIHVSVLFSQIIPLLPREFHGQRSLAGCSQWAYEESDTTERLILTIMNYWKMNSSYNIYRQISTMISPSGEILGTVENRVNPVSTHHLELGVQWQRPLEISTHYEGTAPHSSTLAWKIPWMEEPGRLQSMGSWRVRHDWVTSLSLFIFMRWRRKWQPTPVFLPGESQGRGSLVGCSLWGCTESDRTEAT